MFSSTLLSSAFVFPSRAQVQPPSVTWFTSAATAVGNYPGGVIGFNIFAVDSARNAGENISIDRMVVVTPWANYTQGSLPVMLTPGEAYSSFINATIPSSFTNSSFSAQFVANARFWNGSSWIPLTESARVVVQVLSLPNNSTLNLYIVAVLVGIIAIVLVVLFIRESSRRNLPIETSPSK
ncbi:MAG: hypothetical protein ACHQ1H_11695 [Nitrososphaerales archaeon]